MFGSQFDIPWSCSSRKLRTKKLDLSAGTLVFTSKKTEMAVNYGMFISQIHLENNPSLDSELHATWQSAQLHHTDRVSVFGLALVAHPRSFKRLASHPVSPSAQKSGKHEFPSLPIFPYLPISLGLARTNNKTVSSHASKIIQNQPGASTGITSMKGISWMSLEDFFLRAASLRLRSDGSDGLESSPLFYANNA